MSMTKFEDEQSISETQGVKGLKQLSAAPYSVSQSQCIPYLIRYHSNQWLQFQFYIPETTWNNIIVTEMKDSRRKWNIFYVRREMIHAICTVNDRFYFILFFFFFFWDRLNNSSHILFLGLKYGPSAHLPDLHTIWAVWSKKVSSCMW